MSVFYQLTFICDSCGQEYMVDSGIPAMPPHWVAVQFVLSNKDGITQDQDLDNYLHFCCQDCLSLYSTSQQLKEKLLLVDQEPPDEDEEDEEEDIK